MIAILEAKRAGLLARAHWARNLIAGVVVGVVALPLAMAFAIASGAKPEQGLYTAIVAGVAVSLLGGSRVQIAGPTGAFIVILAGITAQHGVDGLQIATVLAGLILLLMGVGRMGAIIKFIPSPVIVGFTAGIAVVIWTGQWKDFFGLPAVSGTHFHEKLLHNLQVFPQLHWATTALAVLTLLVVIGSPRVSWLKRIPGPLIGLLVATLIQAAFKFDGVATIGSAFGGIPRGLPSFQLPEVTASRIIELIGPAFTIAMLGAIESLLSAVVADGMAGTRHDSNQELIGQGVANMVAPLFGGFAATGAIARTATNVRNGGTSPIAGIVHAITLVGIILFLAPLAVHIPLAALAAILFVVAWNMSEAKHFLKMLRQAPLADSVVLLVTFGLTVFVDLVVAVNIGVILATLHFLRRMAAAVEVQPQTQQQLASEVEHRGLKIPPGVLAFVVEGPFFFGAMENFERALAVTNTTPKVLILRLRWVPFIDATGIERLEDVIRDLQRRGVRVMFTGANVRVAAKLQRGGLIHMVGKENMCADLEEALQKLEAEAALIAAAQAGSEGETKAEDEQKIVGPR